MENKAFPPSPHPYNDVPRFKLPVENKTNTPTLNGGEREGGVWIVLFS